MGEAVEHIPQSVPPSFSPPPPHLPPAAAAAAALRRARTLQCKDCSNITFGARQGLVFRGQTANFSDGYIVQLDSLLAQASPHVSNSSLSPSSTRPPPPTHSRSPLFLAHASIDIRDYYVVSIIIYDASLSRARQPIPRARGL